MTIAEKLKLSEPNQLTLIKEGLFLKAYNESCYILTALLGHKLKISGHFIKCLNHRLVVGCAFPFDTLAGQYNLDNYAKWLDELSHRISAANAVRSSGVATSRSDDAALAASKTSHAVNTGAVIHNGILLPLNSTQLTYLVNWQRGNFPLEVEQGFIESLKNSLSL